MSDCHEAKAHMRQFAASRCPAEVSRASKEPNRHRDHWRVQARFRSCYACTPICLWRHLGKKHAHCYDRFRLCRARVGSVSRGFRSHRCLYRHRRAKNRGLESRKDADFRTRLARVLSATMCGNVGFPFRPILPARSLRPKRSSSRSARLRGAATAMPIFLSSIRRHARLPPALMGLQWS